MLGTWKVGQSPCPRGLMPGMRNTPEGIAPRGCRSHVFARARSRRSAPESVPGGLVAELRPHLDASVVLEAPQFRERLVQLLVTARCRDLVQQRHEVAVTRQGGRHRRERSAGQLGHLLEASEHIRTTTDPTAEGTGSRRGKYDVLGMTIVQRSRVVAIAVEHFFGATHSRHVGMFGRDFHWSMLLYAVRRRSSEAARHQERTLDHRNAGVQRTR